MKKTWLTVFTLIFLLTATLAPAQQKAAGEPQSCSYCGMDLQKFAHTAMLIEYEDGSKAAVCSLHCAAIDLALNIDKSPAKMLVGDYLSKRPVDAAAACWTIGGDLPGVMTKRAKWAFENTEACKKFAAEHGATVSDLDAAMKASYEDMYADTKMIRDKRKAKKAQHEQEMKQQQPK
ncbi:MAG: nitrous oxide reductase accessory protein NosL [Syntrophobacteraceae bacterium]